MRSRRFPGTGSTASTKRILGLTHTPDCSKSKMRAHILSRVVHTGLAVFDKYLGDALYAMIVYAILRLLSRAVASASVGRVRDGCNDRHRVVSTDNDSGPHACE